MNKFSLTVATEEKTVLETEAESVVAPGTDGYLGIWAHHAPLLTSLKPGRMEVRLNRDTVLVFAVSGGFLEVANNKAIVLADSLEAPREIDVARAKKALERALERMKHRDHELDLERAQAALARARNRLAVATA